VSADHSLAHTLEDWRSHRQMWLEDDETPMDIGDDSVAEVCWREGRAAFEACRDHNAEDNPYSDLPMPAWEKRGPWYWGYRAAAQDHFNALYRLDEMQNRIRAIVVEHGCKVAYDDEYGSPYAATPEGYHVELA
jgi:hypothetical protein